MKAAKRPPILRTSAAALLAMAILNAVPAKATQLTWTGQTDNFWETPTNWNPPITPFLDPTPSDLIFTGNRNTHTFNNGTNDILNSISFDARAANFVLSGNGVTLQGGGFLVNNSTNLQVVSFSNAGGAGGIQLSNANFVTLAPLPTVTFNAAAGDILITNDVSFAALIPGLPVTLRVTGPHDITMTGSLFEVAGTRGNLLKDGTGTLRLMGQNTYHGFTTINGGTLLVDGSTTSPVTYVNPTGTLGGTGLVGGSVFNDGGNVAPGDNSRARLSVGGNYIQSHTGTLTIEVGGSDSGDRNHDSLAVGNHARLDGNLRIVKVGKGCVLHVGDKIDILTATNGVTGKFSDVSYQTDTIINTKVVYSATTVSLEKATGYYEKFARDENLTPNQLAVAQGLDKVAFRNKQTKLIDFLDCESVSKLPDDFDRIAPEELTSMFTIGVALANVQTANLQRRTDDIRAGSRGFSASGFAAAGSGPLYSGGLAGPSGYEGKESKEVKNVVPAENRWGVFITGVGEWVNVHGDDNARGYDITTGGFTVGADYKVTPNLAVGVSAGYAGTGSDLTNGGRVFVNGGKLGLYATYFTGGFYVDTAVNGGFNSYDTRRDGLNGTARGSTDGGEFNALFGTGYDFKVGGLTVGPTASFQYTYLGIDDFSEHGSLAPLTFHSQHQDSLRTALGIKASYDWKVGGVIIRPEVRAAWQHEYGDDRYALDSSFSGGNGNLFTVTGPQIGRDSLLIGAGFAVIWSERLSTYVYYDGELGRENYDAHNVSGGVRVSF